MSSPPFVNVATAPARSRSTSVPGLGTFGPLTGPVVGPDGSVYLGTLEGKVLGLRADGSPYWNRQLPGVTPIIAAPAVGSDGTVYVIGARTSRDHRDDQAGARTVDAVLYAFTGDGGVLADGVPMPAHGDAATNVGAPAVWEFGGAQAVVVPVLYRMVGGADLRLLAFSRRGELLADTLVSEWVSGPAVGGGWMEVLELLGSEFTPGTYRPPAYPPFPGAGIGTNPQGGTPWIVVCDRPNTRLSWFTFCLGAGCSPAEGFTERFRTSHAPQPLLSEPAFLLDMRAIVGTDGGAIFSGPGPTNTWPPLAGINSTYATPTIAAGARAVLVSVDGDVTALHQAGGISTRVQLSGQSIASAAASRTHVFVATTDAFYTLDAAASTTLATFPWVGGGFWSPAVGPQGHVYALASDVLFVFPPPSRTGTSWDGRTGDDIDGPM